MQSLAKSLNVSYQQIQKCEFGRNRIGAGRLYELCSVLGVPITFFFEGIPQQPTVSPNSQKDDKTDSEFGNVIDQMNKRDTLEIVRAFCDIADPNVRKKLLAIARLLGKPDQK